MVIIPQNSQKQWKGEKREKYHYHVACPGFKISLLSLFAYRSKCMGKLPFKFEFFPTNILLLCGN